MKDLLDVFYIHGSTHEIILYAITIDPHQPIRMSLSPVAEQGVVVATKMILDELQANERARSGLAALATYK
jgi:hypothetical protein